jgi:hypothetical protein
MRPVDVWFQVNVHCVSVWDVKPPTPEKPPTFWDKHGTSIKIFGAFALGVWIGDEVTELLHWLPGELEAAFRGRL